MLNYNSKAETENHIDLCLTDEANLQTKESLNNLFMYGEYYEYNNRLVHCPHCAISGEKGSVCYDLSSIEVLEKTSDNEYIIAVDFYGSGYSYSCTDRMVVKYVDGHFKLSSIIHGDYQDKYYKYDIPYDYEPPPLMTVLGKYSVIQMIYRNPKLHSKNYLIALKEILWHQ